MDQKLLKKILAAQRHEKTEQAIYENLAKRVKNPEDRKILESMAEQETGHYDFFKKFTQSEEKAYGWKVFFYSAVVRLIGINFCVRLLEKAERNTQEDYEQFRQLGGEIDSIIKEEEEHETKILDLMNKDQLQYAGSIVLGLNDALVEITGALAGFTLALQNTRLIAIVGLITGVAASLSMAFAEYLSTKEEEIRNPVKAMLLTGTAYTAVVLLLIFPFFLFSNPFHALTVAVACGLLVIFAFTFYISVAKNLSFWKRFLEMAAISLGVATVNFFIGLLIRKYIGVDL